MVSFHEALERLLHQSVLAAVESCRLEDATGRVLRRDVTADREFPPFDRVMMDGYALRMADWKAGCREFQVLASAAAGMPAVALGAQPGACVEVMTGAPCPTGADTILPVEEVVSIEGTQVVFHASSSPEEGGFIHLAGSDAVARQVLLAAGRRIGTREIGVAASCGAAWVEVSKIPSIAVMATGDELVAVSESPGPYQIRQSNAHALAAALKLAGYPAQSVGVVGDEISVAERIVEDLLASHDWLILTGAVSKGARDFVPSVLRSLGCREIFHGIAQRPGKPAGCWAAPGGQVVVALPGNPVSAITGLHTLVLPALSVASGQPRPKSRWVVMDDRTPLLPGMTRHLPVTLQADGRAEPAAVGNSGDFIGLLASDGFLTLPPRGAALASCVAFPFTPWL